LAAVRHDNTSSVFLQKCVFIKTLSQTAIYDQDEVTENIYELSIIKIKLIPTTQKCFDNYD